MPTAADGGAKVVGLEALHLLKSTDPPLYLTPSPELSKAARLASQYLFSSLSPHARKSPFTHLLTEGFDAEQIWQQIDLQAQPLLASLRRHVRYFDKNLAEIDKQFPLDRDGKEKKVCEDGEIKGNEVVESESEDLDDDDEEEEDEEGEDHDEDGEMENEERENLNGVDDEFFKMKEMEELIAEDEARKYGLKEEKKKRKRGETADEDEVSADEEGNDDEEDEDGEEEDDELELMGLEDDDEDGWENARYEDFFVRKKSVKKRKPKHFDGSDDMEMDESQDDGDSKNKQSLSTHEKELEKLRCQVEEMEKANLEPNMQGESLSTHEKELETLRLQIEEMEKANMEPKTWTMQGEVTANRRPKNSALEVDLDFEHNVRPAPVITEVVTASLEEIIQKRVLEEVQAIAQVTMEKMEQSLEKSALRDFVVHFAVEQASLLSIICCWMRPAFHQLRLLGLYACPPYTIVGHLSVFSPQKWTR